MYEPDHEMEKYDVTWHAVLGTYWPRSCFFRLQASHSVGK
jgi:hypothetical protein